ncbi:MAG: phospholipid/cholesterol/gamma-HCH transport system substrate-binding protein [Thermoleophilaceae bacterium]|nr:phospholipid/cholesterol/gamma-HCH transport system substrate-binding protein [Thermoleophilaceae bacterium]
MPVVRSGIARRRRRMLALGAVAVAVVALAFVLTSSGGSWQYRVVLQNAGLLVHGDIVRVGGVQAGTVDSLDLTPDGQAVITLSLDKQYAPLHAGTRATVRASGIATVTGRFVDISPGPSFRPALDEGAAISVDNTTSIVDIDQLLNAFDGPTRHSVRQVLNGFATWYDGRGAQARASARYFAPALQSATHLFDALNQDSGTLEEFVVQTGGALDALAKNKQTLTDLVSNTRATAHALGSNNQALSQALQQLPPALKEGSDAFVAVRAALPDLDALVTATEPVSYTLAPFFKGLRPVVSRAVPAFRDFRLLFDQPGPSDDLLDALKGLPGLAKQVGTAFPQAEKTLADGTPVLSFIRPYAPDLLSFIRSFGSAAATYDGNGHYARTIPVFDAFGLVDDPQGGTLVQKTPSERGSSPYLSTDNLRRCPGTSAPGPADGSAPFVDTGALANADCDPTQTIGKTP